MHNDIAAYILECRIEKGLAEGTISRYARVLTYFADWTGIDTDEVTNKTLIGFALKLREDGIDPRSLNGNLGIVVHFLKHFGVDDVEWNPMETVHNIPDFLSPEQIDDMVKKIPRGDKYNERDRVVILTLFASGIRASELCNLRIANMDIDYGLKVMGKGKKERFVPMPPEPFDDLRAYVLGARSAFMPDPHNPFVFIGQGGEPLSRSGLWRICKKWGDRAGLKDIHPHIFRHSMATALINRGCQIRFVQEILGHSSINTTQIYTQVAIEHLRVELMKYHPAALSGKLAHDVA